MGKIKNDFLYWFGNNYRTKLHNGSINVRLSELGEIVEQYITYTADRLKRKKDNPNIIIHSEEAIPGSVIPAHMQAVYDDIGKEIEGLSDEEFEDLKRRILNSL